MKNYLEKYQRKNVTYYYKNWKTSENYVDTESFLSIPLVLWEFCEFNLI